MLVQRKDNEKILDGMEVSSMTFGAVLPGTREFSPLAVQPASWLPVDYKTEDRGDLVQASRPPKAAKAGSTGRKSKPAKKAGPGRSTLPLWFGVSASSVMALMGKLGFSSKEATAAVKAQGIVCPGHTVRGNMSRGRAGLTKCAELTPEQLDKLSEYAGLGSLPGKNKPLKKTIKAKK